MLVCCIQLVYAILHICPQSSCCGCQNYAELRLFNQMAVLSAFWKFKNNQGKLGTLWSGNQGKITHYNGCKKFNYFQQFNFIILNSSLLKNMQITKSIMYILIIDLIPYVVSLIKRNLLRTTISCQTFVRKTSRLLELSSRRSQIPTRRKNCVGCCRG